MIVFCFFLYQCHRVTIKQPDLFPLSIITRKPFVKVRRRRRAVLSCRSVLCIFRVPECLLLVGECKLSALCMCVCVCGELHVESNTKPALKGQCLC